MNREKKSKLIKLSIGSVLLAFWVICVIRITMVGRIPTDTIQYQLRVFWCIEEAWNYQNANNWYYIIGNIALFIPIGMVLPSLFSNMRKWYNTLGVGFAVSLTIEVVQLIYRIGLFEIDDLINNTVGCFLGYCLFVIGKHLWGGERVSKQSLRIAIISWVSVVGFFVYAISVGQPVFEKLIR